MSIGPEFGNMRYMHSTPHMTFFTAVPNLVVVQEKMETRSRARSVRPESLRALMPSHCQFPFSADLVCGTRSPGIACYALVALAAGANAVYASMYHALASKAEPALSSWRWCSCLSVHHACLWCSCLSNLSLLFRLAVLAKQLPRLCPIENLLEHPNILECHTTAGGALLVAPCWWCSAPVAAVLLQLSEEALALIGLSSASFSQVSLQDELPCEIFFQRLFDLFQRLTFKDYNKS